MERINLFIYAVLSVFALIFSATYALGSQADINGTIQPEEFANYPSWFPRERCKTTWRGKSDHYEFQRSKFPKDLENETRAYADYATALSKELGAPEPRRNCYKTWTVLVVMDAGTDLHGYATWDLYEMEAAFKSDRKWAGSTLTKDLLVQHTGFDDEGTRRLHMFQQPYDSNDPDCTKSENCKNFVVKPREFFIQPKKEGPLAEGETMADRWRGNKSVTWIDSPVVEKFSNDRHPTKLARLKDFLEWGVKNYPSKYTLVVVWGHGMGWLEIAEPGETLEDDPVLHLRGHELAEAIRWVQEEVFEGKRKIDNVFTDACHMQSIEIAAELAPYVRFYTGSAQVQSFLGLPYRTLGWNMGKSYKNLKQMQVAEWKAENPDALPHEIPGEGDFPITDEPYAVADLTPELMRRTLSKGGFQGRVDTQSEEFTNASTFFTYSSFDSEGILMETLPALDRLAKSVLSYLKEPETQFDREDLAFYMMDKLALAFPFHTTIKTRELGNFIKLLRQHVEEKHGLPELNFGVTCSEALFDSLPTNAHKIQCAASLARRGLQAAIVRSEFATTYEGNDFEGVAVWIPRSIGAFRRQIDFFHNTKLMQFGKSESAEFGAWGEMLKTIMELSK